MTQYSTLEDLFINYPTLYGIKMHYGMYQNSAEMEIGFCHNAQDIALGKWDKIIIGEPNIFEAMLKFPQIKALLLHFETNYLNQFDDFFENLPVLKNLEQLWIYMYDNNVWESSKIVIQNLPKLQKLRVSLPVTLF
jgi:hypothetical protein